MIEMHIPVCLIHNVFHGDKMDYVDVNTPEGDNIKFAVEKDKLKGVIEWGNRISIKSKIRARVFKNGLSLQLVEPQAKVLE